MEEKYLKMNSAEAKFIYRRNICLLKLSGEIDVSCYPELTKFLKCHLDLRDCPVIFDLNKVTFMDSTGGLRIMLEVAESLGSGRIAIVNANDNIKRLFKLTNMTNLFPLYNDLGQATQALSTVSDNTKLKKSA